MKLKTVVTTVLAVLAVTCFADEHPVHAHQHTGGAFVHFFGER